MMTDARLTSIDELKASLASIIFRGMMVSPLDGNGACGRRDCGLPCRRREMVRVPTHRQPTHPGEMLLEEFLKPMGITQRELADRIHVPYQRVNELINKRRGMTPARRCA